jgi:cephalosporin hydroxylase
MMKTQTPYQGLIVTLDPDEIESLQALVRDYSPDMVVELGTYKGGSALVMADVGVPFIYTYDKVNFVEKEDERVVYRIADILSTEAIEEIKSLCMTSCRKILFCDNGLKKKEINTFGPFLNRGDILCAHDYGTEFNDSDISGMIRENKYEQILQKNRLIAWEKK